MSNREKIVSEALAMPPEDRAYVADVLERSLETDGFATPEIAAAWSKEIDRRIAAYDRGETNAVDVETSSRRLREVFAARRRAATSP
ncbi:MAG: addiction module protein [Planctomycetaceae bacterium]